MELKKKFQQQKWDLSLSLKTKFRILSIIKVLLNGLQEFLIIQALN
ncbi:hypothetical protein SDC9_145618 [bioreactor metagenome]|uniref:Uncharacterized protein n=1 Tax=bioreactor metagenome TaxID=1076179 RepID=A0A645ECP6_9ZZZZ